MRGGRIVKHHINEVANAVCVARRESTMVYVIEWDEEKRDTGNPAERKHPLYPKQ